MTRKRVARSSGNCSHAIVHDHGDIQILAYDVFLGVAGALVMIGVPFILAVLKQWGWW